MAEHEQVHYMNEIKIKFLRIFSLNQMFDELRARRNEQQQEQLSRQQYPDQNKTLENKFYWQHQQDYQGTDYNLFWYNIKEYEEDLVKQNDIFYEFALKYRNKYWEVRRTEKQLENFFQKLNEENKKMKKITNYSLNDFNNDGNKIAEFFQQLFQTKELNTRIDFLQIFMEISVFNFEENSNRILKQGYYKGSIDTKKQTFTDSLKNIMTIVKDKWFIIFDKGIGFIKENKWEQDQFEHYFPYKNEIFIKLSENSKLISLGSEINKFHISILHKVEMIEFVYSVYRKNLQENRFDSFSPQYFDSEFKFFINGFQENYYNVLCDHLLAAKRYVYITDWWLSPQIYLKRVNKNIEKQVENKNKSEKDKLIHNLDQNYRLDNILNKIANQGVQIRIIIYREIKGTINVCSEYTKNWFDSLKNKNITVIRHPRYIVHFWSHHEKMCLIDGEVCFMGGLDLCYGRYEKQGYPLFDKEKDYPGLDYVNPRIHDIGIVDVKNYEKQIIDKTITPRMPWRDIAVRLNGKIVQGFENHFIEYWNFYHYQFQENQSQKKKIVKSTNNQKNLPLISNPQKILEEQQKPENQIKLLINSNNKLVQDSISKLQAQKSLIKRSMVDFTAHSIINQNSQKMKDQKNLLLLEKMQKGLTHIDFQEEIVDKNEEYIPKIRKDFSKQTLIEKLQQIKSGIKKMIKNQIVMQPLRSASNWSIGLQRYRESSIYNAYIQLIKESERFIYIENQFFISKTGNTEYNNIIKNNITIELLQRIKRAIDNQQKFLVILVLPLLAGFEGNITDSSGELLRIQVEWHLNTIRGLINGIQEYILSKNLNQNWIDYFKIFGLRNHDINQQNDPITEIVYVHSKLMIVDDRRIILGSANINDRSMSGGRDSELAVLIEPPMDIRGQMNGQDFLKSQQVMQFRQNCFGSIFTNNNDKNKMMYFNQDDILQNKYWDMVHKRTNNNQDFYYNVFKCYPDNRFNTIQSIIDVKNNEIDKDYYHQNKNNVFGVAVEFPVKFLIDQKNISTYTKSVASKLMPKKIFT